MKILVISDAGGLDGAQGSLRFATRYWKEQLGWEIDVFEPRGGREIEESKRNFLTLAGMNLITKLSQETPYKVVLVNSFLNIDYLDKIGNIPVVFWVHEADTVLWAANIAVAKMKQLFARPQKIIFSTPYQSETVFRSFIYQIPLEKIAIIPYGIEPVEIPLHEKRDDGVLKLSWLGNVIARKRPADLANAVMGLHNEFPLTVNFIGSLGDSYSLGEEFVDFIKQPPPFISWNGAMARAQALEAVAQSDIYCQTSGDESFALAPLEAAALGVPVILANLPVYQFVGWKHGENCLLYAPGDVAALAQCIRELRNISSLRLSLANKGRALAQLHSGNLFLGRITQLMSTWGVD
jgi:glycosyltransferase involved in cell wall biosynthesis